MSLSCTDVTAGCSNKYYKILTGDVSCTAGGYTTYSSAFSVTGAANALTTKTVCYYSKDTVNNTESYKKQVYKIDEQDPSFTFANDS